jgi:hypothetical protein
VDALPPVQLLEKHRKLSDRHRLAKEKTLRQLDLGAPHGVVLTDSFDAVRDNRDVKLSSHGGDSLQRLQTIENPFDPPSHEIAKIHSLLSSRL